jgi:hypothetical protein
MGATRKTTTSNGQRTKNLNNGQTITDRKQKIQVQEPYWRDKKVNFFHDCNVYASSADENRACIITHKNITGLLLHQFSDRDHTAGLFKFFNKDIIFCSEYMPNDPPQHAPPKLLIDLVEYAKSKKISIIVSEDSNARGFERTQSSLGFDG